MSISSKPPSPTPPPSPTQQGSPKKRKNAPPEVPNVPKVEEKSASTKYFRPIAHHSKCTCKQRREGSKQALDFTNSLKICIQGDYGIWFSSRHKSSVEQRDRLRKQGIIPCEPCCRILQHLVKDVDSADLRWFYTLADWWGWTAEQKSVGRMVALLLMDIDSLDYVRVGDTVETLSTFGPEGTHGLGVVYMTLSIYAILQRRENMETEVEYDTVVDESELSDDDNDDDEDDNENEEDDEEDKDVELVEDLKAKEEAQLAKEVKAIEDAYEQQREQETGDKIAFAKFHANHPKTAAEKADKAKKSAKMTD